jgi:glycosyltransferase involved in cell wall biosynthesis
MFISFILISCNIRPYLAQCLRSLAAVARAGDELILVDDGSTDGSAELIASGLTEFGFDPAVSLNPVCLGANTTGGIGIPANIGLSIATRDTVFFVDGGDWIVSDGFNRARARMTVTPADILIANYGVVDEARQTSARPTDSTRWHRLLHDADMETLRLQALSLTGVPWRKFYRRSFLETPGLRFPEGDFLYEDHPFHWAVCLATGSIRFHDAIVCQHRVNRLGRTIDEDGMALTAFFTHFQTIERMLHQKDAEYHLLAVAWLVENMAWHCKRLSGDALYPYALQAASTLSAIPEPLWTKALARNGHLDPVWFVAERLHRGDVAGQVSSWEHARLHRKLNEIETHLANIAETSKSALDRLRGQDAADRFAAIKAITIGK